MLILSRKLGEDIIINEDLIVRVCEIDRKCNVVKLGFEADKLKWLIDRMEIFYRKVDESLF